MEEPLRAELFFPPVGGRAVLLIWKTLALNPRAASNEMFNHEGAVDDAVPTVDDPGVFGTCSDDCKVRCGYFLFNQYKKFK